MRFFEFETEMGFYVGRKGKEKNCIFGVKRKGKERKGTKIVLSFGREMGRTK